MDKPPQILLLNFEQIVALSKMQETIGGLQEENALLKAEVDSLRKELADAQENYHLVNEMVARLIKEGKPSV